MEKGDRVSHVTAYPHMEGTVVQVKKDKVLVHWDHQAPRPSNQHLPLSQEEWIEINWVHKKD